MLINIIIIVSLLVSFICHFDCDKDISFREQRPHGDGPQGGDLSQYFWGNVKITTPIP